ncbi:MAG: LysM peptidoglycan-binding domain-containing protein [Bacteroidales bacterium]|nr:LysM peptidoglycan-binding domain-containing protein [Bacteroidales bacterium]
MKHILIIAVAVVAAFTFASCSTTKQTSQKTNATVTGASDSYEAYILTYYPIAVEQMHRHKIPASITLAQGLLESGAGKSTLTQKSNNHFGIKANNNWQGRTTTTMDNGRMCEFRVYNSARESYEDHSQFLLRPRYASLFKLSTTDYKGWARGLKKAGYAEDPAYPQKLINLIERYKLYEYDKYSKGDISSALGNSSGSTLSGSRPLYLSSGLLYVVANNGDTFETLSSEFGISRRKLIKYNDLYKEYNIKAGDIIYLEKKHSKAGKEHRFHTTGNGESLYSISQKYGVRLKNIYKMNPEYESYSPLKVGDVVRLR